MRAVRSIPASRLPQSDRVPRASSSHSNKAQLYMPAPLNRKLFEIATPSSIGPTGARTYEINTISVSRMPATTASLLPTVPRIFFLYIEPILITSGIAMTYANRLPLLSSLTKVSYDIPTLSTPAISCTYLFSMMLYGLVILLSSPPNKRLLQLHIGILALADFTHWFALFNTIAEARGQDWTQIFDTHAWDSQVWNLVLYPLGTLLIKFATLMEWFGPIQQRRRV